MFIGRKPVSKETILSIVSEEELFDRYCDNFKALDTPFRSELREDSNPSCRISDLGSGLRYKDFGTDNPATDIWGYIQLKHNLTFIKAIERVASDYNVCDSTSNKEMEGGEEELSLIEHRGKRIKPRTVILIKKRDWLLIDKQFWFDRYKITKEKLENYSVMPISHYWIGKENRPIKDYMMIEADLLAYCYNYYWHDGILKRKIYQPFSKTNKWVSNVDNTIVQGIDNIPKQAPILVMSTSLKDIMDWDLLGYPAIAPNSEATWISTPVWEKMISRYNHIVTFFDNDISGLSLGAKYSKMYNTHYSHIPTQYKEKNVSDFIWEYGVSETNKLIEYLFNEISILSNH